MSSSSESSDSYVHGLPSLHQCGQRRTKPTDHLQLHHQPRVGPMSAVQECQLKQLHHLPRLKPCVHVSACVPLAVTPTC